MKRFAGTVGTVEAYRLVNNVPQLAFVANTLTDSTLTISSTQDEIKGGAFAPTQFVFSHDTSIKVSLTDILWKPEYIEAQLGTMFQKVSGGQPVYFSENVTAASGKLTLTYAPIAANYGCSTTGYTVVAYAPVGSDNWTTVTTGISGNTVTDADLVNGVEYCVHYMYTSAQAQMATVTARIIPQELRLVIRAPLFYGDACGNASDGKAGGEVQYLIEKFKMDGQLTLSMAMSSNQTTALNGTALASDNSCDPLTGGIMLKIIEITPNTNWYDDAVALALGDPAVKLGDPEIYAVYKNGTTMQIGEPEYADLSGDKATLFVVNATAHTWTYVNSATSGNIGITNVATVPNLAITIA